MADVPGGGTTEVHCRERNAFPMETKRGLKPRVLIGPVADDPTESVSVVNRTFIEDLAAEFRFIPLAATRRFGKGRQCRLNVVNLWYFQKQLLEWLVCLLRDKPDVAHYAITSGWALAKCLVFLKCARRLGVRTLGHLHGGGFMECWSRLSPWQRSWARRELTGLDGLAVLSEGWRCAVQAAVRIPDDRLFVVNNPLDRGFEAAALSMPVERLDSTILSLGVMEEAKGVLDIIEAASLIRGKVNATFCLAGPEREAGIYSKVRDRIDSACVQDSVLVKGPVWGAEKVDLFRDSGMFLLPSYFENSPLVLIEAAASGMAIITTPVGAVPEFLEDGVSAVFVEPGNSRQIAGAVARLANSPEERNRIGRAARQSYVTRFGRAKSVESLAAAYHRILSSPRN